GCQPFGGLGGRAYGADHQSGDDKGDEPEKYDEQGRNQGDRVLDQIEDLLLVLEREDVVQLVGVGELGPHHQRGDGGAFHVDTRVRVELLFGAGLADPVDQALGDALLVPGGPSGLVPHRRQDDHAVQSCVPTATGEFAGDVVEESVAVTDLVLLQFGQGVVEPGPMVVDRGVDLGLEQPAPHL